jgi:hypothetical protein
MLKYIREIPEKLQGAVGRSASGPSLAVLGCPCTWTMEKF